MNLFSKNAGTRPGLNKFDLSHEKKMSLKMGKIYPIVVQEILPGDSFKVKSEILLRMAPMIAPVMHRVNVTTHYFFIPNRLVWNEWEDFITGGETGESLPVFPQMEISETRQSDFAPGRLPDYMGIPNIGEELNDTNYISALPFRANALVWNEFFRDQNLDEKIVLPMTSGVIAQSEQTDITTILTRAWEKDYFTSALPESQRGGEATIPLGTVDPVYKDQSELKGPFGSNPVSGNISANQIDPGLTLMQRDDVGSGATGIRVENLEQMEVDPITINNLRKSVRLQAWLEKAARGGSRYIEFIKSMFGVTSSDARLQRPEYLGGGSQPVVISEVLSTAETAEAPQANMSGHGISVGKTNGFTRRFEEHGYVIGVMSVIPRTAYQQGIDRHFTKFDKFDYYWKDFAHLGEQEILNKEIYFNPHNTEQNNQTWGYQQRYAEYKYQQSSVHGDFRTDLSYWQMGRIFPNLPNLNAQFVKSDPTTRIFAVEAEDADTLYCQIYNRISALRPMPYHSIPDL